MPQRPSLDDIFGGAPSASQRPSLDDIFGGGNTPAQAPQSHGLLDTLKNRTWRDWTADAVRLGGGYLAGIPALEPGVGTAIGSAIGGGSEALAQFIGGHGYDAAAMGVGAAAGAIPMGRVFSAAKGLGLGARAATMAGNVVKGAALNTGVDMAYRGAHGELPIRDYGYRDEILPATIGAAGAGAADLVGEFLRAKRVGRGQTPGAAAGEAPGGVGGPTGDQPGFNFDAGAQGAPGGTVTPEQLAKARGQLRGDTSGFDRVWGDVGAPPPRRPPTPPPAAPPVPLELPDKLFPAGMKNDAYSARRFGDFQSPATDAPGTVGEFLNPRRAVEPRTSPADLAYRQSLDDIFQGAQENGGYGANANRPRPGPLPPDVPMTSPSVRSMQAQDEYFNGLDSHAIAQNDLRPARGPLPPDTPLAVPSSALGHGDPIDLLMEQLQLDRGLGAGQLEIQDPATSRLNGSGESSASMEALNRQASMRDKGESFVVYDRAGQRRPLIGPDAVDYNPRMGETYGIEGPQGFRPLTDYGGRAPGRSVGPQPILPGSSVAPGADMLTPPSAPGESVPRGTVPAGEPSRAPYAASLAELSRGTNPVLEPPQTIDRPYYPKAVRDLHQELGPLWEKDYAAQLASGNPITHDPRQSLSDFALQTMFEEDPRKLMGRQRKVRQALDAMDQSAIEMVDEHGNPMPVPEAPAPVAAPPKTSGYQARPSAKQRAQELIDQFLQGVPPPPEGADPDLRLYHQVDARRQATEAAIEALRKAHGNVPNAARLPTDLRAELKRIQTELTDLTYTGRSFTPPANGMGGTMEVSAGSGGSKVFHDIMEGKGGSRAKAAAAVKKFLEGGKPTAVAKRALDVAIRRTAGDPTLLTPGELPPGAGYGGEAGGISQDLAFALGGAAAGSVAGPMLDKDKADPLIGRLGGAYFGGLAGLGIRNPELLERIRSSGLFSGAAIPKSALGNVGALVAYAIEHPGTSGTVAREAISPETWTAAKRAYKGGQVREVTSKPSSAFAIPSKLIGAPDAAARDVLQRVVAATGEHGTLPGIAGPRAADEAGRYTLSGAPRSELGKAALGFSKNRWARLFQPVMRTPVNWAETGLERLPGVANAKQIKALDPEASTALRRRRQVAGAAAIAAGVGAGAATEDTPIAKYLPYLTALAGPFGLPLTLGTVGEQALNSNQKNGPGGAGLQALVSLLKNLPIPTGWDRPEQMLKSYVPFAGAMRAFSPVDPADFKTALSYFGPALSQIPGLNEALLPIDPTKVKKRLRGGGAAPRP